MKREGVWREVERGRYRPRSQTLRSRLYEQTKHVQSIILSERCQSSYGICLFHISTNIETSLVRQYHLKLGGGCIVLTLRSSGVRLRQRSRCRAGPRNRPTVRFLQRHG